jgi:hypothetical protein
MSLHRTFILRRDLDVAAVTVFIRSNWQAFADSTPLAVTVMPHKDRRSLQQNARLHAILTEISDQAWIRGRRYDVDTWKEFFKMRLIGTEELAMPDGKVVERGISTTTLDVAAFADFMDRITAHATSELSVIFSQ